jgi:hypothetical protein
MVLSFPILYAVKIPSLQRAMSHAAHVTPWRAFPRGDLSSGTGKTDASAQGFL